MTAIRQQRDPMQATSGLDDYVTSSKVAYSNLNRIPTIKMEDKRHLKYQPHASRAKNFDIGEVKTIENIDTREKLIRDLDTGMSPFMKNQNDHM